MNGTQNENATNAQAELLAELEAEFLALYNAGLIMGEGY